MQKIGKIIDSVNENIGRFVSYFLLLLMFVILTHVLSRYILGRPTIWSWDTNRYFFGAIVLLGGGYHILRKQVITVDVLYNHFPAKMKAMADMLSFLAILIFCAVIVWKGAESAWSSFLIREKSSSVFAPPLYPLRMLLPVGAFLILLQAAKQIIDELGAIFFKRRDKDGN